MNMNELKQRKTENGIDYALVGDYYIPDLKLPEENRPIGNFGRLHREFLKENFVTSNKNVHTFSIPVFQTLPQILRHLHHREDK